MSDNHHDENEAPSYDDINTSAIVLSGVIAAVVTLITIFFVQGVAYQWQNAVLRQRDQDGPTSLPAVQQIEEQKSLLAGGEGAVSIDDAMKKVIDANKK
jgi:hypothetical protein